MIDFNVQVLLKFNPAELGNIEFICIAYPLSSIDDVQNISVPDRPTCDPPPVISPALVSLDSGNMSLENDTGSLGNDSISVDLQALMLLNDSMSSNDTVLDNILSQETTGG